MWRKKKVDEWVVVTLLNQAKAEIHDPDAVNRLLREVGKFFDPLTGRAMLEGGARAEVMTHLERGEREAALASIDRHIETCQRRVEPRASRESCVEQPACSDSRDP
ncbi:MAG TPA: hypothetical protein VLH58_07790 [Candidatus Methylomirabilis sp.]|nr:hypothetical protein [Candidatus Methylomirabilis sp.]HSC71238.1 hypothetical protein [Candidatus Methylomirabilis sp.]